MSVYKRVLALDLSLLMLLSLAACAVQQGEDYADFVPPEETDTLVVYGNPYLSMLFDHAIALFKKTYPDVNVEYRRDYDQNDFGDSALLSELAAGEVQLKDLTAHEQDAVKLDDVVAQLQARLNQ